MSDHPRIPHIMKRHISNKMPASLLFFDTETKTQETPDLPATSRQILKFGFAYYYRYENGKKTREKWSRFTTSKEFYKFLISCTASDRPVYCFAHNLGFDLTILDFWRWTENEDFRVEYFVLSDPPTFVIGRYKERKIIFIDTLNYWRQSLAAIGKSLDLPKLEMPGPRASNSKWDAYGKRDVEILALAIETLMQYVSDNDLGQFGLSAASMAMSTFKHKFMKHQIFIHDNRKAMTLERECYYGGFTHCFFVGKLHKTPITKLDINSMYPFVMRGKFPSKFTEYLTNPSSHVVTKLLRDKGICAHVAISSKTTSYPVPYNDRLCYCNGQFTTYLAGPELLAAIYNGHVAKILSCSVYDMDYLFRDYVDFFWKERQRFKREGNEVNQIFVKLFMNMLYGKFGQMGYDTAVLTPAALERVYAHHGKIMPDVYKEPAQLLSHFMNEVDWYPLGLHSSVTIRRINNSVQIKVPNGEHNESFPAISAYVTSYARELLWSYIRKAGPRNVYYCDTDSLFVNYEGFIKLGAAGLISQTELGMLKIEGQANYCEFWCPKDYVFGDKATRKGIRHDAKLTPEGAFSQIQFEGIKSVLKRGYAPYIDVNTITKTNSRKFTKGIVGKDGWTIPFTLPMPPDSIPLD